MSPLCRDALPDDEGFRPSFLGHILVELLLDAALIAANPPRLDQLLQCPRIARPAKSGAVNEVTAKPADRLAWFIERFCEVRFLYDYADDAKLWFRLNQVLSRSPVAIAEFVRRSNRRHPRISITACQRTARRTPYQKRIAS